MTEEERFEINCGLGESPPTSPITQHFTLGERLVLILGWGKGRSGDFLNHNDLNISNCTMHLAHIFFLCNRVLSLQFKRKSFSNTFFSFSDMLLSCII